VQDCGQSESQRADECTHETESGARGSLTHRTSRDLAISKTRAGRESTLRRNRAGTKDDKFPALDQRPRERFKKTLDSDSF